jgi:acetoin:2,6-dichlorophenolindophenol oxidoreductase subunit beta
VCFDQLYNQAAKFRYMFGGKAVTPVTIRTMIGAGFSAAAQHSQSPYSMFAHVPGLKSIIPSNPYDAKGLLAACIQDDDPCIFFEHKALYTMKGEVPEEHYTIPLGKANVVQEGKDVTIVALAAWLKVAVQAAKKPWPRKASSAPSSTPGPSRPWTRTPSSPASRKPVVW